MKTLTFIQPKSDDTLKYDEDTERYYLTIEFCKAMFEPTLKNDHILEREIERNTNNVYDYIFSKVNTNNMEIVKNLLNKTKEGKKLILRALEYQMEANLESGFNSTGKIPLVNASNGQIISREELKRNQVSVEVERLLDNSNLYLGVNIFYAATFPAYYIMLFRGM